MKLIAGLGNPGKEYQNTRHNAGWMALEKLAECFKVRFNESKKLSAELAEIQSNGDKVLLLKPLTFMNGSGVSVQAALNYYKIKSADLVVIHDDKDIEIGKIKIQTDRSSAGHKGVQSIIDRIKTQDFTRVRLGVGRRNLSAGLDTAKYVLGKFGLLEKRKINKAIESAVEKIVALIDDSK